MRISLSSLLQQPNNKGGYILIELILSLIITFTLITLLSQGFNQIFPIWNKLTSKTSLFDVGHYMTEMLEKNIAYDAGLITITKDTKNRDKLICKTVEGDLTYTFYCDNQRIYKTISRTGSSGTNPLYVSDCKVLSWRLTRISEKQLLVEIELQQNTTVDKISRLFYCLNGWVETNAS